MQHYRNTICMLLILLFSKSILTNKLRARLPLVINTWNFENAGAYAWQYLLQNATAIDSLVAGVGVCEQIQCDFTVGYGGSPDENGETRLDALIFDGATMDMGAVGSIGNIRNAIGVAKHVLQNTDHSFIVGDLATQFANKMDFTNETLQTNYSINIWEEWKTKNCQPNFWKDVEPDPTTTCGPYHPISENSVYQNFRFKERSVFDSKNHDTIGMIVIDQDGNVVAGTSTNGAKFKIPGRVGDSPIPGAGAYADNKVGAAVATGDGDIMMRFLPTFLAVEEMRNGKTPEEAATIAVNRIKEYYPKYFGAVIAVNRDGDYGAACNGMEEFPYVVGNPAYDGVVVEKQLCSNSSYDV